MARGNAPHLPRRRSRASGRRSRCSARAADAPSAAPTSSSATSRPTAGRRPPRRSESSRWCRGAQVEYRGTTFEEMDVDAIIARRPAVALVDELAHTNVPGSRHEKRWEDVEELLDAGITVISTLNIQHLESVNDVVEQITGIKQQETIPDAVVRRADQIELVDMAPEAIRRRMAHGNIYPAERIDAALGELLPHRESRRAARARAAVGRRPRRRRARSTTASATASTVPGRRASGSSSRSRAPPTASASCVARPAWPPARRATSSPSTCGRRTGSPAAPPTGSSRQRELVEELGGTYREVVGADIGEALVATAHTLNATQIVLGATRRSRFTELTRGSVINRVIRDSGVGLDVHVISRADDGSARRPRSPDAAARRAASAPACCSASCSRRSACRCSPGVLTQPPHRPRPAERAAALPPARRRGLRGRRRLACALRGGRSASCSSTGTSRRRSTRSRSSEGENLLALSVFLAVAAVVSAFVSLAARRAADGARARAEAEALAGLAGAAPVPVLLDGLRRDPRARCRRRLPPRRTPAGRSTTPSGAPRAGRARRAGQVELDDRPRARARGPCGRVGRGQPHPAMRSRGRSRPRSRSRSSRRRRPRPGRSPRPATCARRSSRPSRTTSARRSSGIKASVTSLLQEDVDWTPEARREFLVTIDEESDRLNALVGNLLDMSRLQTGALDVSLTAVGRRRGDSRGAREHRRPRRRCRGRRRRDASRGCSPTRACSSARSRT